MTFILDTSCITQGQRDIPLGFFSLNKGAENRRKTLGTVFIEGVLMHREDF